MAQVAPPEPKAADVQPLEVLEDIRSVRPYLPVSAREFMRRLAGTAVLIGLDLVGLALGVYIALVLRDLYLGNDPPLWGALWRQEEDWLPFLTLVAVLVFWQRGLYGPRERRGGFGRVTSGLVIVLLLTLAFGVGTGALVFHTYTFFPIALVITTVLIGSLRASHEVVAGELIRLYGPRRRVLLIGQGEMLASIHRTLGARGGYEFIGVLGPPTDEAPVPAIGTEADLSRVLRERDVDELIVADHEVGERELMQIVDTARRRGVRVRIAPKTTELLIERAEYVPGQGIPLFELKPPIFAGTDWVIKRAFDLTVSVLLIVAGLPLWLAIGAAIKLTSPGPVFYRDQRVGLRRREFTMLKFRTMIAGADEQQAELEWANEADGPLFKIRDDPRVTSVGLLLRRLSLDEIPQVLNVLRGEMSLVGPRPLRIRDYRRLEDWHRKRDLVLPGMTGLWQISGRSALTFDDLVRLDFYYIENWSIWLDISILAKTLPAVFSRRGAY
jgi:exopolysaccharide biosynthesis polyprenyl glycosylphosphotransferase